MQSSSQVVGEPKVENPTVRQDTQPHSSSGTELYCPLCEFSFAEEGVPIRGPLNCPLCGCAMLRWDSRLHAVHVPERECMHALVSSESAER